jgi:hypothetical protein
MRHLSDRTCFSVVSLISALRRDFVFGFRLLRRL